MFWLAMVVIAGALFALFLVGDGGTIAGLTTDQFAGLVGLSLIGTLIASGMLAGRQRLGSMAKQALAWLSIIAVLVIGYEYRFELQNGASRVTAGLIPGAAIATTDADGARVVTINRRGTHFETNGLVNGTRQDFLVDTGASTIVMSYDNAARAGLDPQTLQFSIPVSTANGIAMAARTRLDEIEIGGIRRDGMDALVADQDALSGNLLGMNFLNTLSGYDVRGDRLILRE